MVLSSARRVTFDFQRALAVDAAGEELVARFFVHQAAFAGDRRLVDGRSAGRNTAVHGDAFAGPDEDQVADGQFA